MSAIYGIINKNGKPVEPELLNMLQKAIAHRAKDGSGVWNEGNVALGFCKLILQPQQNKEQLPIEINDIVLTADARIDNRDELYNLLSLDKKQWQQEPDSRLAMKAYQQWQEKCVDYLDGEFVLVIWNKQSQRLFVTTDHIGTRPVFYYDDSEQFVFCSEIKGIEAVKKTSNYFNEESLIEYHFRQSDPSHTYNKEIHALCGGNTLTISNGQLKIKKYWTLQRLGKYNFSKDEEWANCLRDLLYKAIEKRLHPDLPTGITLSGGLDSTSITCILSELLQKKNKPLYTFSSVLALDHKGIEQDERQYIELVNKYCPNIIQTYVEAADASPFKNIESAFNTEESFPNIFSFMDTAILEAAKDKNIRSLFSGIGGDYWVSRSGSTVIYHLINQLKWREAWELIKEFKKTEQTGLSKLFIKYYIAHSNLYGFYDKVKKSNSINWQKETMLKHSFVASYDKMKKFDIRNNHLAMILELVESGRISRIKGLYTNRNSFYNMESADPMLDRFIYEFLADAPERIFVKGGYKRGLLRNAMKDIIPEQIRLRTDKLPYAPGYHKRILQNTYMIRSISASKEYDFIFDRYMDREKIIKHFQEIKPQKGFSSPEKIVGIRIMQSVIVGMVLKKIKEKNYKF